MKKLLLALAFVLSVTTFLAAQRSAGAVGIGAQFGQPTGLSLKIYQPTGLSTDILVAWDLNDFFFVNIHGLAERHLGSSESVHYFIGPGLFVGVRESNNDGLVSKSNDFVAGISGTLGLNVILGPVELFGQVTPRLELIDETAGDVGGGIGIRIYLD